MFLLAFSSLLLLLLTYTLGKLTVWVVGKWLQTPLQTDFLGCFFLGLLSSYTYFNIASFFVPVNYKLLVPLLALSMYFFSKKENRADMQTGITSIISILGNRQNLPVTFSFGVVLFLFWLIPPGNWDSGDYHYLSIQWYEDYAVVPGLANVHGRLAFNPANFIISAAYSFTSIVGQPLYPLNGVIELLFFAWLLRLTFRQTSLLAKTILLGYAIMRARDTLINITSPSSDMLVMTLLSYCAITAYFQIVQKETTLKAVWPLLLIAVFGPCTKLSALPTLLLLPILWFGSNGYKTGKPFYKTAAIFLVLWLPWLVRNAIMSGYLLYPINHTNFFPFDWAIPKDVLLLDDFYTRYASRGFHEPPLLAKMNLGQLTLIWLKESLRQSLYPLSIAIGAFIVPIAAQFYLLKKKLLEQRIMQLIAVYYIAAIIWLIYSPEYRFGITLLELLVLLSLLQLEPFITVSVKWLRLIQVAALLFMVSHFSLDFIRRPSNSHLRLSKHWFFPARDYRYLVDDNYRKSFPYEMMQYNTPLYFSDTTHRCLNACLPCMSWRYGKIEMRGKTLQQGFRNVKNEVRKNYPWLPE